MDKNKYFLTGEFAKIMNITKNTLFHYDKIGLFSPEVKLDNEYRYYSIGQMEIMQVILMLKELGMPLAEIREYLDGNSTEELLELYEKELEQIHERIRQLKQKESWLKEQKQQIFHFSNVDINTIHVQSLPERYYFLEHSNSSDERSLAKKLGSLIAKYNQLRQFIGYKVTYIQHTADLSQKVYNNYHDVMLVFKSRPRGCKVQVLPAGNYLTAYHKGHWDLIGDSYERLFAYAGEHSLALSDDFLETDIVDRLYVKSYNDYVTEITVRLLS